ncbi:hypothetical protein KHA80_06160 [Anaerobacillus sp. HL2]|nr:hypothetical protein KHA80_06160 [Anaerobacillus sp. HL2]
MLCEASQHHQDGAETLQTTSRWRKTKWLIMMVALNAAAAIASKGDFT